MSVAAMPVTPAQRDALRRGCRAVVGGHPEAAPGEELEAIGAWCREHGWHADRYGDGTLAGAFEAKVAALLGKDAGVFMPSGTLAQQAALAIWCERAGLPHFAMHATAHLELHEYRAYARLSRLSALLLGPRERPTLPADLAACPERIAALLVELPAREIGGQLPTWDDLVELAAVARARGVRLHMDGARLWEAREAYAPRTYAEICALFDSVYVSFYKGIGALSGALLAGDAAFVAEARVWRRRYGGTLSQLHPYIASAAMRIDAQLAKMPAYRARALALAKALAAIPGLRILPSPPQVNMFHVHIDAPAPALATARDRLAAEDGVWLAGGFAEAATPGWSVTEIYVGDNLLALADADVAAWFARLVGLART
ncbi:MAG: threonine aldolase [Betaproteobacteria bacterium]|nr:threonine aldolase [Betaproteobacteria bacterium]